MFYAETFNMCFEKQVFPSSWCKHIINPKAKNSTIDQCEPSNYTKWPQEREEGVHMTIYQVLHQL